MFFLCLFLISFGGAFSQPSEHFVQDSASELYVQNGQVILKHYESQAYQLKPSKAGHMGLRLFRHYQDRKYEYLLLDGINYTNSGLDKLVKIGLDSASLAKYIAKSNANYKANTEKKRLRKKTLERYPYYRLMAAKILRHVARLDELELRHKNHKQFMKMLKSYDFEQVFTDSLMIKAWGAQLANQVYWLKQLGIADYSEPFYEAVRNTYPDSLDAALSKQQYENKLYTLTHIIIAASGYYRTNLSYKDYASIIDYFRQETTTILKRAKEDVIIEVGISLLLVDESYPEINSIRADINSKVDLEKQMILSVNGSSDFAMGEHRNIIAVLLLDWQGCSERPNRQDVKRLSGHLPTNLKFKKWSKTIP